MEILLALYSFGGLILAGLTVPLILHKVPPNSYYGIRLRSNNQNPLQWYRVNAFIARHFLVVGLGTSFGSIILYFTSRSNVETYGLSCLGLFLALFLWGAITSFLYIRTIKEDS